MILYQIVTVDTEFGRLGLAVCADLMWRWGHMILKCFCTRLGSQVFLQNIKSTYTFFRCDSITCFGYVCQ